MDATSKVKLPIVLLCFIVAICASPMRPETDEGIAELQLRTRRATDDPPSRKHTDYEIGVLRSNLNNHDLYFCHGDPYDGIQCPEEPHCSSWDDVCDGSQTCAVKFKEQCLNQTRKSYGAIDPTLCDGDENHVWCFWKVLAPERCGEDIFLDPTKSRRSANIRSPGYPKKNYPSDLYCFWTVSVPEGRRLSVSFKRFETEENYDYISVGHGLVRDDPRSTVVFKHSGKKLPDQRKFNSEGNSIWITFTADDWDAKPGFTIRIQDTEDYDAGVTGENPFKAEPNRDCGGTLFFDADEQTSLTISSPNYPAFYENYVECEWIISTQRGRRMKIIFTEFDTEENEDFVSVGNGISSKRAPILYKYSGKKVPKELVSRASDVWFLLSTSLAISRRGFQAIIKEEPIAECGGAYIVPAEGSLHVTTQYYPYDYPSNSDCLWQFRNQVGRGLYVLITYFFSEDKYDHFYVGTGFQPEFNFTNAVIWKHSGEGVPELNQFLIRLPEAWIKFKSDRQGNERGFDIQIFDEAAAPRTGEDVIVIDEEVEEVEQESSILTESDILEEANPQPAAEEPVPVVEDGQEEPVPVDVEGQEEPVPVVVDESVLVVVDEPVPVDVDVPDEPVVPNDSASYSYAGSSSSG